MLLKRLTVEVLEAENQCKSSQDDVVCTSGYTFARAARARVERLRRRPSVDGAPSRGGFLAEAWILELCLRTEPLLALLVARCAQLVAPARSTAIQPMATKALVSTGGGSWFRAAGDSAQWMLQAASS